MFSTRHNAEVTSQVDLLETKHFYILGFKHVGYICDTQLNIISQLLGKKVIILVFIFLVTFV